MYLSPGGGIPIMSAFDVDKDTQKKVSGSSMYGMLDVGELGVVNSLFSGFSRSLANMVISEINASKKTAMENGTLTANQELLRLGSKDYLDSDDATELERRINDALATKPIRGGSSEFAEMLQMLDDYDEDTNKTITVQPSDDMSQTANDLLAELK